MLAFVIWALVGIAFIGLGIYALLVKKEIAFGFWANAKTFPVKDVKKYNQAVGKMWIVFGDIFVLLGIPLLFSRENSPLILLSVLGVMFETIAVMVIYTTVIERKYRKNSSE